LVSWRQAPNVSRRRNTDPSLEGASEAAQIGKTQFFGHIARVMPLLQERSRRALECTLVQRAK
jgi:hypothetical protein